MTRLKNIVQLTVLAAAAASLAACGNSDRVTPEEAAQQTEVTLKTTQVDVAAIADMTPMELMASATVQSNQLADVLSKVTDEASADVAIAEMRALGPQLKAVGDRLESLDESDIKLSIKTMKSMQTFAEAQMRIFNETGRIASDHPELREKIVEGFEDIEINFQ